MTLEKWDVDIATMMCRNRASGITVRFTDRGSLFLSF